MEIKSVDYLASYPQLDMCPMDNKKIFAFIGRSNVGKSSLINFLCNKKQIAKTSNTPGKTKTINYFIVNKNFYFVDLPGYGFAKVSKTTKTEWGKSLMYFILNQKQLSQLFILIDISIPPQKIDLNFVNKMGENQIPFVIVFTKKDKNKQNIIQQHLKIFITKLQETWDEIPLYFITSSKTRTGAKELLNFIENN